MANAFDAAWSYWSVIDTSRSDIWHWALTLKTIICTFLRQRAGLRSTVSVSICNSENVVQHWKRNLFISQQLKHYERTTTSAADVMRTERRRVKSTTTTRGCDVTRQRRQSYSDNDDNDASTSLCCVVFRRARIVGLYCLSAADSFCCWNMARWYGHSSGGLKWQCSVNCDVCS